MWGSKPALTMASRHSRGAGEAPGGRGQTGTVRSTQGSRLGGAGGGADARVSGTERGPGHGPSRGDRGVKTTRRGQDSVSTRAAKRPST